MTIAQQEQEIISDFELFEDWEGKYEYLIDLGKSLPLIDEKFKTDDYLIKGCQSKVWLTTEYEDGKVLFKADSDAVITKGIIALLVRVLSNHTPQEIVDAKMDFIDKIGLKEHLSHTRSNGLVNMIKQMKLFALAHQAKA
jgi:cysteine desulfuration protein SufE